MKHFASFILFSIFSSFAISQSIKSLDYARDYAKSGVHVRHCFEVKFSDDDIDSIPLSTSRFDAQGRIIEHTDFFAGGRKLCTQTFHYGSNGTLERSSVSHAFNNWEIIDLMHIYDSKGKLIRRECPIEIRNFWKVEKYVYDSSSKIKEVIWSRDKEGILEDYKMETYSSAIHGGENTPNYVHDTNGLLLIHRIMDDSGVAQRQKVYLYEY